MFVCLFYLWAITSNRNDQYNLVALYYRCQIIKMGKILKNEVHNTLHCAFHYSAVETVFAAKVHRYPREPTMGPKIF